MLDAELLHGAPDLRQNGLRDPPASGVVVAAPISIK
jgi:hypothetical protein